MSSSDTQVPKIEDLSLASPLSLTNSHLPDLYDLSLTLDHTKPNFSGNVTIPVLKNLQFKGSADAFEFTLNCSKLVVTKASLRTADKEELIKLAPKLDRNQQTITFTADGPVVNPVSVEIAFLGSVKAIQTYQDTTYGLFKTNYSDSVEGKSDNYVIATHTQPYGCRTIFPCLDELEHKVPISLTIITKNRFKVVSNAPLKEKSHVEMADTTKHVFEATPPIATSVFGFVIGDLEEISATSSSKNNTPVRMITTKGDSSMARYALQVTTALLPIFEDIFGVAYPLPKFDIVTLPFLSDWVMENWGMVTIIKDGLLVNDQHAAPQATRQLRQIIAHQLTHQWIGNLITFDEWKFMWLTESLATFVGDFALSIAALESSDAENYDSTKSDLVETLMDTDCFSSELIPSIQQHMSDINTGLDATTASLFEKNAYDKGMVILNMVATQIQLEQNAKDISPFFKAFKSALIKYEFKTIKPFDLWNIINEGTKFDVLTFMHSWVRYAGFPCIQVREKNGGILLVQHRYFYNEDVENLGIEDPPFYVPLSIKLVDENANVRYASLMLSDRSMDLDIKPEQLVSLNFNKQSYFKTVYEPAVANELAKKFAGNLLSRLEQISLFNDYGKILGQPHKEKESDIFGKHQLIFLIKLFGIISKEEWRIDYHVLKVALGYLEIINNILVHYSDYKAFAKWQDTLALKLMNKVGGWDQITEQVDSNYNALEYEVRNSILQIASNQNESKAICKKLYKNFVNSGVTHKFIAKELFSSMLNVTVAQGNMGEYKQILALVKNANVSYLKHTNGTGQELQTAALASLGFAKKPELLQKTLHFVNTNIDSKLIELGLLGFKYHHESLIREMIWAWYNVNYEQWVKRSLYKESKWGKQIGIAVQNISKIVLGEVMHYDKKAIDNFIQTKIAKLPPHHFQETWNTIRDESKEKEIVASFYDDLVASL